MGKFVLDPCVEHELLGIWAFIAQHNPEAATRVIDAAHATFADLAATPGLGRPRRFLDPRLAGVRSWRVSGFSNYLIYYRPIADGVQILHVFHGARDLEKLFEGGEHL